jgi:hypothetical protein
MVAKIGEASEVRLMPIDGARVPFPWVHFLPPGFVRDPPFKGAGWVGAKLEVKNLGPRSAKLWKENAAPEMQDSLTFDVDSLARMLAKIAHSISVAELGVDAFEHWLPPYILGADKALPYLIGGATDTLEPRHKLHEITWKVAPLNGVLMVTVAFGYLRRSAVRTPW